MAVPLPIPSKLLTRRVCARAWCSGSFCVAGVQQVCEAGRFGATTGLSSADCTGRCAAGYVCPAGSTTAAAVPCGGVGLYCPEGSVTPLVVGGGNYSVGGTVTTRHAQLLCPPSSVCSGGTITSCPAGYVCPPGTTASSQQPCGAVHLYCPAGSSVPVEVSTGYYTTGNSGGTRTGQEQCEAGACPRNCCRADRRCVCA